MSREGGHPAHDRGLSHPLIVLALCLGLGAMPGLADGGVTFTDIAEGGGAGITYSRSPTPERVAAQEAIEALGTIPQDQWRDVRAQQSPMKPNGAPGVAILDYDGDGDLDIYATNGPGTANSLYSSQLVESGQLTFVDAAAAAGVAASDQDSSGVCYGDIDNDGDEDLYVLGTAMPNRLFENQLADTGTATFVDITTGSGTGGGNLHPSGCSMGDVDNDGLLDIVVGNTYTAWAEHRRPTFINEVCPCLEHNQLFLNAGGNQFVDAGATSGIETIAGMPAASYTWAIAMADYDLDGDIDIWFGDTQGPSPTDPSEERGYPRLFENDGTGHFTDVTAAKGLTEHGSWMGWSFGDFNCDGYLDFFNTNLGDYIPATLGLTTTRHFLGGPDGFTDPGIGDLVSSAFGWGTVAVDYDNDADTDIIYHGGMDVMTVIVADNPGLVLQNQGCTAEFLYDFDAVLRDHRPRIVEGVASGDLNDDGFPDLVTVSDTNVVPDGPFWLPWSGILAPPYDSPLDPLTRFEGVWIGDPEVITFLGPSLTPGDLSVEINSGGNGNGWAKVGLVGGKGLISKGASNRDGIGAVVQFTPDGGPTVMRPVVGGASYASQDALEGIFGLGDAARGTLDVLWPGGVRNRLYHVAAGERITFPEIPCSYADPGVSLPRYLLCVGRALSQWGREGVLEPIERVRFLLSAIAAYVDHRLDGARAPVLSEVLLDRAIADAVGAGRVDRRRVEALVKSFDLPLGR